jgi:hypothetical protein
VPECLHEAGHAHCRNETSSNKSEYRIDRLAKASVAVTVAALLWLQIWDAFRLLGIVE